MVAANYAATRSAMAKAIGLGQSRGSAGARKRGRPPKAIQA
jgi:MucR family transcriptional regulator, transcriptional regulator of exopolysaccharide biosynthesis